MVGVSLLMSLIIILTTTYNKKLRDTHPSILFGLIGFCLFNIALNLYIHYIGVIKYTCYWGLAGLLRFSLNIPKIIINSVYFYFWTTIFIIEKKNHPQYMEIWPLTTEMQSIKILETSNIQSFEIFTQLCILLNICLCIDVFLVFKNPFYPSYKRMKLYIISSTLILAVVYPFQDGILLDSKRFFKTMIHPLINPHQVYRTDDEEEKNILRKENFKTFISTVLILIYFLIATASAGFMGSLKLQKQRSLSLIHAQEFLKKHQNYISCFSVLWLAYLTSMYIEMFDFTQRQGDLMIKKSYETVRRNTLLSIMVQNIGFVFLIMQGILIGLIKLDEPNYYFIWKREIRSWFGLLTASEKQQSLAYTKMQQGLCTELVFSILTLITEHTSGECKNKYKDYDFTNMSAFTLENLVITDRTKFIKQDMMDSRRRVALKPHKILDFHTQKRLEDTDPAKLNNFKQ